MAKKQGTAIEGTLKDMGKSIKMKCSLIQTLEFEYKNICHKTDNSLKELEELTSQIYNLEGYLSASECRLEKYRKKEIEWEKENLGLKQSVDDIKTSLDEARNLAHIDDITFDQNVVKLVEERSKDHSLYDSNTTKQSLHTLELMDKALAQEIFDVRNMLKEEKNKLPFVDSEEVTFVLQNTDLSVSINEEINNLLMRKNNCLKKLNDLKETVRELEDEINELNKRI